MNKFLGIGRLVKDVELRFTTTNTKVAKFTLAINRETKNKEGNYESDFLNCLAFGKQAETISEYLNKGDKISIEGHIQTGSYEKDGKRIYTTDIIVDKVQFLERKGE